jgi:hypothetical protein
MVDKTFSYFKKYVLLFWSIAWRTFSLAVATAILSGVGLGVLTQLNEWPPAFIEIFAPMIGLPVTLLVGAYIVWKQVLRVTRQTVPV